MEIYPRILNFTPRIIKAFQIHLPRNAIQPVILTKGAGCNLLEYGLNSITGKDIQIGIPQHSKMIRYYTEILT